QMQHPVNGVEVDDQTRCAPYRQVFDFVAVKHFCCGTYYCCHLCHAELADDPAQVWPTERFDEDALLCGVSAHQLSVTNYLAIDGCPQCLVQFNPGCKLHRGLYFAVTAAQ